MSLFSEKSSLLICANLWATKARNAADVDDRLLTSPFDGWWAKLREKKRRLSFSPPIEGQIINWSQIRTSHCDFLFRFFFWELLGPPDFKPNSKLVGEDSAKTIGIEPIFPACRLVLRGGNKISGEGRERSEGPIGEGLKRGEREKKIGSFFLFDFSIFRFILTPSQKKTRKEKDISSIFPLRARVLG